DERYQRLIGRTIDLPLTGRTIPIIGDGILVDPEFGTGVVKVTPAHDRNDYEAGKRNALPQLQVIDEQGKMTAAAGKPYTGLDRAEARKKVVEDLQEAGLLRSVKPHVHAVARCGKCDTVVEPMISRQWFVRIQPLAEPAIAMVRDHTVELVPESWESTYFNWMENIHDWCISRQLWWGHRIPAFYCGCGEIVVTEAEQPVCARCGSADLRQETDVLDTWFSSALWPFSTMGWPEKTKDLQRFYPTDVLVTGFDILFFWVARMIMMGLRFTGEVPFRQVYLHGLVRDEHGQKMSKSRGNVIDPLEVIDEYGADAVRFSLAILSTGRDIPIARSRMQGYAAFANKIWNASRFALMHLDEDLRSAEPIPTGRLGTVDRWILARLNHTTSEVNRSLAAFRFDEAANHIYQFFWHQFCDWYIEMVKPVLTSRVGDPAACRRSKRVLLEVLDRSLRLLHPFMPFITEEIWQKLGGKEASVMISRFPVPETRYEDAEAERLIGTIQQIVTTVRNLRAERGFTPQDRFRLYLRIEDEREETFFRLHKYLLIELARLSEVVLDRAAPADAHRDVIGGLDVAIELPPREVPPEQIAKIQKQIDQLGREIENIGRRLQDPKFLERAPAQVIDETRRKEEEYRARIQTLRKNLS
ncbi:MAG TPA: valine--tRNA ligase, partial [Thermoanaerobaculia bacterium]|nr:valine--tRNA ligase [Thermoanaerobaculia bacterium]